MDLDELRSAQRTERQRDSLQHLRDSFYEEAAAYVADLKRERETAADAADDPYTDPDVGRLTDRIQTAQDVVEAVYERRVGKVVKHASFAAADMPTETDGMTAEERELFTDLVDRIRNNRDAVLDMLAGRTAPGSATDETSTGAVDTTPEADQQLPPDTPDVDADADSEPPIPPDAPDPHTTPESGEVDDVLSEAMGGGDPTSPSRERGGDADPTPPDHRGDGGTVAEQNGGASDSGDDRHVADASEPTAPAPVTAETERPPSPGSDAESSPSDAESSPSDAESSPSDAESSPSDAESSPSDAESSPSDAESSPSDAESSPSDAESSPSDTEAATGREARRRDDTDRVTLRMTADVGTIVGVDEREYDLATEDVVTLPAANAEPLLTREAAERLD